MIPDEAVEAAASRYWDYDYKAAHDPAWADAIAAKSRNDETGQVREMMRAALEAAAPHMRQAFFLEMNLRAVEEELNTPSR